MRVASGASAQVGSGSGVIVGRSGNDYYLLTNAHVVASSGGSISVTMPDGKVLNGTVVKAGAGAFGGGVDLAIVKVTNSTNSGAYSLVRVAVESAALGSSVLQAGYPLSPSTSGRLLNNVGRGGQFVGGTVSEISTNRIEGGFSVGISRNLGVGSSGGGYFDANGNLIAIHGREQRGVLGSRREDGRIQAPQSSSTVGWGIDSSRIRSFCSGVVPGLI